MKFNWTKEQENIFKLAEDPAVDFLQVAAVAGASKTTVLVEIAKRAGTLSKQLYLTFSKAMATEASGKFPKNTNCSTIHSLAYKYTVRQYGLKVGWFNPRDVRGDFNYTDKKLIVNTLEEFLLSSYLDPVEFLTPLNLDTEIQDSVLDHLNLMTDGTISCGHSFYLKLFHVLLANGDLNIPEVDLLMIDEAGDLSNLTIEVFKLLPAKKRIMVGDPHQAIFSFMHCSNAFDYFKGVGTVATLTHSFRVSDLIASRVEGFMQDNVDTTFVFKGQYYKDNSINSKMYIARTNSSMVQEMLRLMDEGTPFKVTRDIKQILELPLILANLDNGNIVDNARYKVLEKLRSAWVHSAHLQRRYGSVKQYVQFVMKSDDEIVRGLKVVIQHGTRGLNTLANYVTDCKQLETSLILTSGHSSKGLEADEVEFAPDMNEALSEAKEQIVLATIENNQGNIDAARTEFLLYYVAATRGRKRLVNATHLPRGMIA